MWSLNPRVEMCCLNPKKGKSRGLRNENNVFCVFGGWGGGGGGGRVLSSVCIGTIRDSDSTYSDPCIALCDAVSEAP